MCLAGISVSELRGRAGTLANALKAAPGPWRLKRKCLWVGPDAVGHVGLLRSLEARAKIECGAHRAVFALFLWAGSSPIELFFARAK
jgi:hypothetical protein